MQLTTDQYQRDRRKMKAYIASRLPDERTRVVIADGEGGELWADLDPISYDGEWDLHWETNCREYVDLQVIYDHFRLQEMTLEEWRRELGVGQCRKEVRQNVITRPEPDGHARQQIPKKLPHFGRCFPSDFPTWRSCSRFPG